ncbi:YSIRK-type signal peptide-containing protein [Streptococcus pseudopneumoniae]|uniref:YSIRK-type signal peptide-containing protein n=1 Tax=Streptococcus pseudopneumoniae TaxID=257758 RepID=UPI00110C3761|nr:YSIRK-type signal peptide-containing protein [Streptococcus pseudopneumoniae]TMR71790.1 YSIRK-type signal peptide-containing protein [Streptococcus pseudopneumoniae]
MFYKGNEDREKRLRFSIRKVSFGAASVAVAALFMFPGNGTVSATEQGVTPTNEGRQGSPLKDPDVQNGTYGATPVVSQLDGNSGSSETTASEGQEETSTPTSTDASAPSVESPTVSATEEKSAEKNTEVPSTEANSVENKDKTRVKTEETSTTSAATESKKPKSRKKRDISATPDADVATDDPSANQTYTAPVENADLKTLATALSELPDVVENNKKIQDMDELGNQTGVVKGEVLEIQSFGGWNAISQSDGTAGKLAIARKTESGIFPIETVNTVYNNGARTYDTYVGEQAFDRTKEYMLFLAKVRTIASQTEETFNGQSYRRTGLGGSDSFGIKSFSGIEKTFKAHSPATGSKVKVAFKTGFTGDLNGTKAKYLVEVVYRQNNKEVVAYKYIFEPQPRSIVTNEQGTVTPAKDGTGWLYVRSNFNNHTLNKSEVETKMAEAANRPNGQAGTFTSSDIDLPIGVTDFTVRIKVTDTERLGMGYQSPLRHYALPVTGTGFSIEQDTRKLAKNLLQRIYNKSLETETADKAGKTDDTVNAYTAELETVNNLLTGQLKTTADYKKALSALLEKQEALVPAATNEEKSNLSAQVEQLKKVSTENKTPKSIDKYNEEFDKYSQDIQSLKEELRTILEKQGNATKDEVSQVLQKVEEVKRKLDDAKSLLVEKGNKTELRQVVGQEADVKGNFKYYNADKTKKDAYDEAIKNGQTVIADANADQTQVDEALKAIEDAQGALTGVPTDKEALTTATNEAKAAKTTDAKYYNETDAAKKAAYDDAITKAEAVLNNPNATQEEVNNAKKAIEDAQGELDGAATDKSGLTPVATTDAETTKTAVAPAANAPKASKELPNTGTADSTVAMVAAAASALLGLGLAGRRRKEDEEA